MKPEKFIAPIEKKQEEFIEVQKDNVLVSGIELSRNKERKDRVPDADKFKDFSLDDFSAKLLEKIAKSAKLNQPLLLEGDAAVGKSYTIEYLANLCNQEVFRMSLNGQIDVTDFIGKWVPRTETLRHKLEDLIKNPDLCKTEEAKKLIIAKTKIGRADKTKEEKVQEKIGLTREESELIATLEGIQVPEGDWVWQDGEVPKQMENGAWSVLDEVNTCEPQILVRLNSLLEKQGQLVLHEDGAKIVKRHPNFRLFATVNPPGKRFKGRVPLSAEWMSRWNYQNIGELPKNIRALRLMTAEGVEPPKAKLETPLASTEVVEGKTLTDYYGKEWVSDLFIKYAEFAVKAKDMISKGEIAKDQEQFFDIDQRDDNRFREYLRGFNSPGNMKKIIQDAIEYYFLNKIKDEKDRRKLKMVALELIKVNEPKARIAVEQKGEIEKTVQAAKVDILNMEIPEEHRKKIME